MDSSLSSETKASIIAMSEVSRSVISIPCIFISGSIDKCILRQGVLRQGFSYFVSYQWLAFPNRRPVLSRIKEIDSPRSMRLTSLSQNCLIFTGNAANKSLRWPKLGTEMARDLVFQRSEKYPVI